MDMAKHDLRQGFDGAWLEQASNHGAASMYDVVGLGSLLARGLAKSISDTLLEALSMV